MVLGVQVEDQVAPFLFEPLATGTHPEESMNRGGERERGVVGMTVPMEGTPPMTS
jgi:hypothetical protein